MQLLPLVIFLHEPVHVYKDSDQPVYPHSLIRVFNGCSIGNQGAQTDLNLCCPHMLTCTLCYTLGVAYINTHLLHQGWT